MARIVILANSKRPDGQYIAGIDLASRQWVRPVTKTGDGIPAAKCFVNGKFPALRDILEIELIRPRSVAEFQRENQFIRNWNWQIKRRLKLDAVPRYVDDTTPVLHSKSDRVRPAVLECLSPDQWKSLQLVKPRKLTFGRHYFDPNRWVANFQDKAGNCYSLKVTDADVTRRLENRESISKKSLLTISMTRPWTHDPNEKPPYCYKVVAAVIELA